MQLAKCKWCGKPFQSFGLSFCPKCIQELDEQYRPVRDYLYDNPNATIEEVEEATGVSKRIVLYYLRDGRLQMTNSSGLLRCEQCGEPINSGRLCDKCASRIEQIKPIQARTAQTRRDDDGQSKMHINRDRL